MGPAFHSIEAPWWGRASLAAAAGALAATIARVTAPGATAPALLFVLGPACAALQIALADLGRRPFAPLATLGAAAGTFVLLALLSYAGAALGAVILGGWAAARLAAPGRHLGARRRLLFVAGCLVCPFAAILAFQVVRRLGPPDPLALGLALFQALYWFPVAGAEAALARAAELRIPGRDRSAPGARRPDERASPGSRERL